MAAIENTVAHSPPRCVMDAPALTSEQREEADRIYEILRRNSEKDLRHMAQLLASKPDGQLFGATEFELRDRTLEIAAMALETALSERKKGVPRFQPRLPPVRRKRQVPTLASENVLERRRFGNSVSDTMSSGLA
jgi:hypothetical protein